MERLPRKVYTCAFKQEAVRMVESGQTMAATARSLGVVEQTLFNGVKAQREGSRHGFPSITIGSMWIDDASRKVKDCVLQGQRSYRKLSTCAVYVSRFHFLPGGCSKQAGPDIYKFSAGGK